MFRVAARPQVLRFVPSLLLIAAAPATATTPPPPPAHSKTLRSGSAGRHEMSGWSPLPVRRGMAGEGGFHTPVKSLYTRKSSRMRITWKTAPVACA